jgi:hypothetical protein
MITAVARAIGKEGSGENTMRSVLALGLVIALCATASAAPVHRSRARPHAAVSSSQGVTAPGARTATPRFAVPGWSDEDTRRWLDGASALWQGA